MAAYSFQRQFIEPIQAGTKVQTIRAVGKRRHAKVGGQLQLYFGMRTKHCRKIVDDKPCLRVDPVRLDFVNMVVFVGPDDAEIDELTVMADAERLALFAVADGFKNWDELVAFWRVFHPGVDYFEGVMVGWAPATWRP